MVYTRTAPQGNRAVRALAAAIQNRQAAREGQVAGVADVPRRLRFDGYSDPNMVLFVHEDSLCV